MKTPRLTAAERREIEAALAKQQWEEMWNEFAKTFHKRTLKVVFSYMNSDPSLFKVDMVDDEFYYFSTSVDWEDSWTINLVSLPTEQLYQQNLMDNLHEIEDALDRHAENMKIAADSWRKKQGALAKLTQEERKLLGLS